MTRIKKTTIETYNYVTFDYVTGENKVSKLVQTIEEFYYDSEEEKNAHSIEMVNNRYEDSMQVKDNVGTFYHPEYRWYGKYWKYTVEDFV